MTTEAASRRARTSLLLTGILALALGLAAFVWPGATLFTISLLFGIYLVVTGALRLIIAVRTRELPTALRWFVAVLGIAVLVAGVLTILNPFASLEVIAYIIGIGWIIDGIAGLFGGMPDADLLPRGLAIAVCVISIVAGIVILLLPRAAVLTFLITGAAFLVAIGIMLVAVWFFTRSRPGSAD